MNDLQRKKIQEREWRRSGLDYMNLNRYYKSNLFEVMSAHIQTSGSSSESFLVQDLNQAFKGYMHAYNGVQLIDWYY